MLLASVGHVFSHGSAAFRAFPVCVFVFEVIVEFGSVFPHHTIALYFHCWCSVFERDGSDSMF